MVRLVAGPVFLVGTMIVTVLILGVNSAPTSTPDVTEMPIDTTTIVNPNDVIDISRLNSENPENSTLDDATSKNAIANVTTSTVAPSTTTNESLTTIKNAIANVTTSTVAPSTTTRESIGESSSSSKTSTTAHEVTPTTTELSPTIKNVIANVTTSTVAPSTTTRESIGDSSPSTAAYEVTPAKTESSSTTKMVTSDKTKPSTVIPITEPSLSTKNGHNNSLSSTPGTPNSTHFDMDAGKIKSKLVVTPKPDIPIPVTPNKPSSPSVLTSESTNSKTKPVNGSPSDKTNPIFVTLLATLVALRYFL